jgi:nucleotide-binding universal stress UspA family protein
MLTLNKVLVASDFTPSSLPALRYGLDLAARTGAALHLVHVEVYLGDPYTMATWSDELVGQARAELQRMLEEVAEAQSIDLHRVPAETVVLRDLSAAGAITRYAGEQAIDVVVMGTHGRRGLRHLLLGSVAEEVVRQSPCPVLTVPETMTTGRLGEGALRILVPVDFSTHAKEALRSAKALATLTGAQLDLLHVVEEVMHPAFYNTGAISVYDVQPDIEEKARYHLKRIDEETGPATLPVHYAVQSGYAAAEITDYAKANGIDLIVMATHGLTGLAHFFMGSVAEKVVRTAPCPVFVVKSFGKPLLAPATAEVEAAAAL